jgi:hypothetical protein
MSTETLQHPVMSTLEKHVNRNLLKWAAGHVLTCPGCGDILDCKRTVSAEIARVTPAPKEVVRSYVMCSACWDKYLPKITQGIASAKAKNPEIEASLDVVDGREVFKR